jgi:putative tryptophan/tyrosine transport system substrate-binding protein
MNYKNITLLLVSTCLIISTVIINKTTTKKNNPVLKIGILQTASHPALDAARDGFIDTVKAKLGDNVECVIANAQGSIITAHALAERFHADASIAAIYAIATPALQAIMAVEKEKPIFIAAVSNPSELGVIMPKTNVCGTTDMIDIPGAINAIKNILPHIASVALIYNPSEANSVAQVALMEKELLHNSIKPIRVGIVSETEIPQAIASALNKADALLAPTDNLVASAMPIISRLAQDAQKPLIASHNEAVAQGALMARGVDYYTAGKETGEIAVAVLRDKKAPYILPIRPTRSDTIVINKQLIDKFGITIPKISDTIIIINENN